MNFWLSSLFLISSPPYINCIIQPETKNIIESIYSLIRSSNDRVKPYLELYGKKDWSGRSTSDFTQKRLIAHQCAGVKCKKYLDLIVSIKEEKALLSRTICINLDMLVFVKYLIVCSYNAEEEFWGETLQALEKTERICDKLKDIHSIMEKVLPMMQSHFLLTGNILFWHHSLCQADKIEVLKEIFDLLVTEIPKESDNISDLLSKANINISFDFFGNILRYNLRGEYGYFNIPISILKEAGNFMKNFLGFGILPRIGVFDEIEIKKNFDSYFNIIDEDIKFFFSSLFILEGDDNFKEDLKSMLMNLIDISIRFSNKDEFLFIVYLNFSKKFTYLKIYKYAILVKEYQKVVETNKKLNYDLKN